MEKDLLSANEIASALGITRDTLDNWYRYKKDKPNDELAKMLPEKIRKGKRIFWKAEDLEKIKEFQATRPIGRNGSMGGTTQKYQKNDKEKKNNNYIDKINSILKEHKVSEERIEIINDIIKRKSVNYMICPNCHEKKDSNIKNWCGIQNTSGEIKIICKECGDV